MYKYLSLLLILFTLNLTAQKVKVKKGKVLIDGEAVAKVSALKSTYTFTSLINDNTLITKSHRIKINDNLEKKWITIYNADQTKSTELDMEYFSASMNAKKLVAEFLIKRCNLITKNGIENLDKFLEKERPNLSDKYDKLIFAEVAKQNDNKKKFIEFQIFVDINKQNIKSKNNIVGRYTKKNNGSIRNNTYTIYDLDNNKVAIANTGSNKTTIMLPYSNKKFLFNRSNLKDDVTQIVNQLYLKDIFLEHQIKNDKIATRLTKNEMIKDKIKDEIQILKDKSVNIYNQKGYVIDKDGSKKEGIISLMFEDLYSKSGKKVVEYKGKAKKLILNINKKKGLKFMAKNGVSFCINEGNKCYKSLDGILGKTFYEVLYESKDSNLFLYGKPGTKIMRIVKKGSEEGYTFNTLFKKKNIKKLNEYLKCDKINDNLNEFNYRKLGDVKKLIELYNKNCSK